MNKIYETTIKIIIKDLDVDEECYSFHYQVKKDEKQIASEYYSDSHDWGDDYKSFEKELIDGYMYQNVLENIFLDND